MATGQYGLTMKLIILLALCAAPAFARRLPFVVGGQDVDPIGKWPWQASLQVGSFGSFSHTCGGSLITNNHVITAAHCVSRPTTSYIVVLGMHDRIPPRQDGDPKEYQLTSYVRHPDWVRDGTLGFPNDVAVIRLASAADVSSQFIAPATLSPADNADGSAPEYVGENCFISGWGRLYGFGPLPDILQEANIDVLTEAECTNAWGARIQRYHICLQDRATQQRGACNGDSGGPLVCQVGGTWTLAGVTSWGRTGCITTSPSVYARVSYFRQWIDQQTASL